MFMNKGEQPEVMWKSLIPFSCFTIECGIAYFKSISETFFINVLFIYTVKYGVIHEESEKVNRGSHVVKKQLLPSFQICQF